MAYDEDVADRVRGLLGERSIRWDERKMFGSLAFMVNGKIAVGVRGEALLLRCSPDAQERLLAKGACQAQMGARTMAGWLDVPTHLIESDAQLDWWVTVGVDYVATVTDSDG